jgi:hypothetical protein
VKECNPFSDADLYETKIDMQRKIQLFIRIFGLLASFAFLFGLERALGDPQVSSEMEGGGSKMAMSIARGSVIENFKTSLSVKEGSDTLIVPAKLVQKILNDDIVVTYPAE